MKFEEVKMKLYPQRAKGVEPDKIPWNDPNYIFETKYDGDRRLLYILDKGNRNTSRSKAADTGIPVEKTDQVPHIRDYSIPELNGTILDCEFTHIRGFKDGVRKIMGCLPEKAIQRQEEWGYIEVKLFDIICYKGTFAIDEPYHERHLLLKHVYETHFKNNPYFQLVERNEGTPEELQEKLNEIINNGGEGMVAKHINSTYRLSTEKCLSPLKNAWIKVKKEFNGDFVVTGFEPATVRYTGPHIETHLYWMDTDGKSHILNGLEEAKVWSKEMGDPLYPITKYRYNNWIGGIKFAEYEDGVLVERGNCSGMTESVRADISANPEKYIGKVLEIDAMERIPDTKALRQPVFKRFRDDKEAIDCQYSNQKG